MGKVLSSLGGKVTRPLRDFNLEERAFKEITKEKRPAAPRHESTAMLIEESIQSKYCTFIMYLLMERQS